MIGLIFGIVIGFLAALLIFVALLIIANSRIKKESWFNAIENADINLADTKLLSENLRLKDDIVELATQKKVLSSELDKLKKSKISDACCANCRCVSIVDNAERHNDIPIVGSTWIEGKRKMMSPLGTTIEQPTKTCAFCRATIAGLVGDLHFCPNCGKNMRCV